MNQLMMNKIRTRKERTLDLCGSAVKAYIHGSAVIFIETKRISVQALCQEQNKDLK